MLQQSGVSPAADGRGPSGAGPRDVAFADRPFATFFSITASDRAGPCTRPGSTAGRAAGAPVPRSRTRCPRASLISVTALRLGLKRRRRLFEAFLAGEPGVATAIYHFVQDALPARSGREGEARLAAHIDIGKLSRKVRQEAHRMKGFVRFEQTADDRYLALVAPRYDVLPLVRRHFEKRFADQAWIIYDTRRNYGLCYDRHRTRELTLDTDELHAVRSNPTASEQLSQTLWQRYFAAVNIAQRANPRLHLSKLPRRYWRYLTEKKNGESVP